MTPSGAALLGLPDGVPDAELEPPAVPADDQPLVEPGPLATPAASQTGSGDRPDAKGKTAPASVAIAGQFGWGAIALGGVVIALGGLVLGAHLLAVLGAQRAAPRPSVATEEAAQPRQSQPRWPGVGPAG